MHVNDEVKKIIKKEYTLMVKLLRFLKYHTLILIRKEDSPESIAHGMAIGIAVGFLPVVPLQTIMAIVVCSMFKKNKVAGIIGTNVFTNPFIEIPMFYLFHYIGKIFIDVNVTYTYLKEKFSDFSLKAIAEFGLDLYLAIFLGGAILAVIFYWPSYIVTRKLIIHHREKLAKNRLALKIKEVFHHGQE